MWPPLRLAGGSCSGLQRLRGAGGLPDPGQELMQLMLVWTAPDGISRARMSSMQSQEPREPSVDRLSELGWIRRSTFSNFMA